MPCISMGWEKDSVSDTVASCLSVTVLVEGMIMPKWAEAILAAPSTKAALAREMCNAFHILVTP